MAKVTIEYTAVNHGKQPGDREELELEDARPIVQAGVARYATVPDTKAAGVPPEEAATKHTS